MDFDVGDVVVYVGRARTLPISTVCKVIATQPTTALDEHGERCQLLKLLGRDHPRQRWWSSAVFRKLPRADESFTAEMRALRPHRERLPA